MRLLILPIFLLLLVHSNDAHNWMIEPRPYHGWYKRTVICRGIYCQTGCQRRQLRAVNSRNNPAKTYQRGQQITVKWTRNNHRGGFFRVALVPVDKMWSRPWQERLTIMHGCWESGEFRCSGLGSLCGTDKTDIAYRRNIRIPNVFPDGDYVFAFVWYGGIEFTRSRGRFGDYFSCSHVRIRGGNRLSNTPFTPYWEPGRGEHVRDGKCQTSSDAVGVCGNRPCSSTRAFWSIPRVFKNGNKPKRITPSAVTARFETEGGVRDPEGSVTGKSFDSAPSGRRDKGICDGNYCCASSCGQCGGRRCDLLPGAWKCCKGAIRRSGRRCSSRVGPPCRRS